MYHCKATIAVLLTTYNGEEFLSRQIESLLEQTYQDFSIYIHDDGSKDQTVDIIRNYCRKFPDKIFSLDGVSTGGAKNNFFYLMQNVDADYYMFCDQDDFWKKEKIQKSIEAIQTLEISDSNEPLLAFTDLEVVDSALRTISPSMNRFQKLNPFDLSFRKIMCQNPITGCTIIMNKELNTLSLRYKNIENIIMHDWWVALVAARYGKIAYCDQSLIKYCQHGDNTVGAFNPNDISYLRKKIFKFSELKNSIFNSRLQAQEFCNSFGKEENKLADDYANLYKCSKPNRIYFYIKHKIWKTGLIRNIGWLLLG